MSNYIEYNDRIAFHPGYYIKELIDDSGITQEDFAKRLDTTPKNLSLLIRGEQSLSIDIATKLSRMLDTSVVYWLNLQNQFDAARAEIISNEMLEEERVIFGALDYSYFCKFFGLNRAVKRVDEQIGEVRRFLNVSSLTVLNKKYLAVCYRSEGDSLSEIDRIKANTMVQIAANTAASCDIPQYNKKLFKEVVDYALTLTEESDFYSDIEEAFLRAGVKLVVIPNLSDSKTNGATKKIGDGIMLMVNDRETYADSFWFTMYHEIGHIMRGDFGISLEQENGEKEREANEFARNKLIPEKKYSEFVDQGKFDTNSIKNFAASISRDPGIVAGRLIHDGLVADNKTTNSIRKKYKICRR